MPLTMHMQSVRFIQHWQWREAYPRHFVRHVERKIANAAGKNELAIARDANFCMFALLSRADITNQLVAFQIGDLAGKA